MTKAEQTRQVAWRLRIFQHASEQHRRVAQTCRYFGISRKTFYKWKKRYEAHGPAGLCDRSPRPLRSPSAFAHDIVSKVLYLRQNYHFGPGRIRDYLQRFHDIAVAVSSVHRILLRHGMNRLLANQKYRAYPKRWQRYEKPQPGHRLQMDVKFLERIPGTRKRLYHLRRLLSRNTSRTIRGAQSQYSVIRGYRGPNPASAAGATR